MEQEPLRSRKSAGIFAIVYCGLLVFAQVAFLKFGKQTDWNSPWIGPLLLSLAFACILGFVFGIWLLAANKWSGVILAAISIAAPIGSFIHFLTSGTDKEKVASWTDERGFEYDLLEESILQGHSISLAKKSSPDQLDILALSSWDEDDGCLRLIGSNDTKVDKPHLIRKGSLLLGIDNGDVWIAYDLRSGKIRDGSEVQELSPFLLLGPSDKPSETDFKTLMDPKCLGRPTAEAIKPDLRNSNPRVRSMAATLLKSVTKNPPKPRPPNQD